MRVILTCTLALLAGCATCRERPAFCLMTGALVVGAVIVASQRPAREAAPPSQIVFHQLPVRP